MGILVPDPGVDVPSEPEPGIVESMGLSGRGLNVPWVQMPAWAPVDRLVRWDATKGVVSLAEGPSGLDIISGPGVAADRSDEDIGELPVAFGSSELPGLRMLLARRLWRRVLGCEGR